MPAYDNDPEARHMAGLLMEQHAPALHAAGVTLAVVLASPGEKEMESDTPPLAEKGHPAICKVKVNPPLARAQRMADATLVIDGTRWRAESRDWQECVLAHALARLQLQLTRDGDVKPDEQGRPKLRAAAPDVTALVPLDGEDAPPVLLGGFYAVAERYPDGPDALAIRHVADRAAEPAAAGA